MLATLIYLVAGIIIAGVLLWGLQNLPAVDATLKQIARIIIIVVLVIWAVYVLVGLLQGLPFPPR